MRKLKKELEEFFDDYIDIDGTSLSDHINTDILARKVAVLFDKGSSYIAQTENEMKPMVYGPTRKEEILFSGLYRGRRFVILNLGTHPTAYVELTDDELQKSKSYNDYDLSCHCGFTYLGDAYWDETDKTTYIGWDYSHCGDYSGYNLPSKLFGDCHKWTTEEIFEDVKECIDEFEAAEWVDVSEPHFVLKVKDDEK